MLFSISSRNASRRKEKRCATICACDWALGLRMSCGKQAYLADARAEQLTVTQFAGLFKLAR